jgi:hypothetical protein
MKVEAIEIYHVAMPLIKPWRTACVLLLFPNDPAAPNL